MDVSKRCLNCGAEVERGFCSNCGQKTNLPRITFRDIISEFLGTVFNVDAPFPRTIVSMFVRPHQLMKEFINGKRKTYYAPVRYLVLCLFINLLIGELIGFDPIENQRSLEKGPLNDQAAIGYQAGQFLAKYLNFFLFILPFSIAFFSRLFFWKTPYNFAERTTMGIYLSAQFILLSLIPILLTKIHPSLFYTMWLFTIVYFSFTFYKTFLKKSKIKVFLKSVAAAVFSMLAYIAVAYYIAYFIVVNFKLEA